MKIQIWSSWWQVINKYGTKTSSKNVELQRNKNDNPAKKLIVRLDGFFRSQLKKRRFLRMLEIFKTYFFTDEPPLIVNQAIYMSPHKK